MTAEMICELLKDQAGVREIVLDIDNDIPYMTIAGRDPNDRVLYNIRVTNADLADNGI